MNADAMAMPGGRESVAMSLTMISRIILFSVLCGFALHWRHNDRDGVSNHRRLDCLLNHLFKRRSKKASKLRVTGGGDVTVLKRHHTIIWSNDALARNIWLNYEGRRPEFNHNGGYAAGFAERLRAIVCHFTADFVMLVCRRLNF